MRVLFLLPYVFIPPDKGNKHLIFNLLKYVTKHAECDLILLVDENDDKNDICDKIRSEYSSVRRIWLFDKPSGFPRLVARLRSLARGHHPSMGNHWNKKLAKWLQDRTATIKYEIVHFDMFYMAQYFRYCNKIPSVLVPSDAYSLSAVLVRKSTANILVKIRMSAEYLLKSNIESEYYGRFDLVCPVAKLDTEYLRRTIKKVKFRTIGIAIGDEFIGRRPRAFEERHDGTKSRILYVGPVARLGAVEWLLEFLQESYPEIRKAVPSAQVIVLGRNPARLLRKYLRPERGVQHIEFVEDYISFLNNDWVYVNPQKDSAGFLTKVQQAMALGLPVVGTEYTFNGLDVENDKHCFICKTKEEFTNATIALLQDPILRQNIGLAAASRIRELYSIKTVGEEIMGYYERVIQGPIDNN